MLLTYPENCVIETCGVVIPSTAGVSCKEPLMRPPINKLFWTVTMAEETKRDMIYYYILHTVQGCHNPVFRLFFQKVKASWLFCSRSPMKKIIWPYLNFYFFPLNLRRIQFLPSCCLTMDISFTVLIKNICHPLKTCTQSTWNWNQWIFM